jgi:hypothetical protein
MGVGTCIARGYSLDVSAVRISWEAVLGISVRCL